MQDLSLDEILKQLKHRFKSACKTLHRSTVQSWIKSGNWDKDKRDIVSKAIEKAKTQPAPVALPIETRFIKDDDLKKVLEDYHSVSYQYDTLLRRLTFEKLFDYLNGQQVNYLNVQTFLDVFRISTANVARLFKIASDNKKDDELLDDLLKMRGE